MKLSSGQLFVITFLFVALNSLVLADESEYKNMEQMIGSIRLEKKQVENMLDKMILSGRISEEEGIKAKRELASLKDDDLENIKNKAISEVKNNKLLDQ